MSLRARAVMCGSCAALTVLVVGSLLPIWGAWHFSPWEGVGTHGTLWRALSQFPSNVRDAGPYPGLLKLHESNLVQGMIFLAVAAGAGLSVFWFRATRRTSGSSRPEAPSWFFELRRFCNRLR